MALQKAIQFRGLSVANCYHEIINVRIDKRRNATLVQTTTWVDSTKTDELPEAGGTFFLPYNPAADVAWAYTQLKQLPEFAGAIDV